MPMISEEMLRDLKRGCWMNDCYKCRHQKRGEETENCLEDADSCKECMQDCACKTCDEGSNWAWECPVKPLTREEVAELHDGDIAWVETYDGMLRCMPAMWIKRGKMYTRKMRMTLLQSNEEWVEEEILTPEDYGKTWRCWKERPGKEMTEAAKWDV